MPRGSAHLAGDGPVARPGVILHPRPVLDQGNGDQLSGRAESGVGQDLVEAGIVGKCLP